MKDKESIIFRQKQKHAPEIAMTYVENVWESERRLFDYHMWIHVAHITMLMEQEIVGNGDGAKLLECLCSIWQKGIGLIEKEGKSADVYISTEALVIDQIGLGIGGKMHTARSRNDLSVTALRMATRQEINNISELILEISDAFLDLSVKHTDTLMPGYTHTQPAQPISFSHYCLANVGFLTRDLERLTNAYGRVNLCPLGSGALATTSFRIDRERVQYLLGFDGIVVNSLDAISSRDFILETLSIFANIGISLSRTASEMILWAGWESQMITLPDEYVSISSMMPQKRNNLAMELIRSYAASLISYITGAMTILKGIPSGYHCDLAELEKMFWCARDTLYGMLKVFLGIVKNLAPNPIIMKNKAESGFTIATDIADNLVQEGISFRAAYLLVSELISYALERGKTLQELSMATVEEISEKILGQSVRTDIFNNMKDISETLSAKTVHGGPSPDSVNNAINMVRKDLKMFWGELSQRKQKIAAARSALRSMPNICKYLG